MIRWHVADNNSPGAAGEIVNEETGESILIQGDWDWPKTARAFGWDMSQVQPQFSVVPKCRHPKTDGTIDCPDCGITASQFIVEARSWLDDRDGATADDPGYFTA